MQETRNSLYALPSAKVCWVVLKKDNTLVRVEGNTYLLPLRADDRVEVDIIMKDVVLFDVYHEKDKVLVLLQQQRKEPISFMLQGIDKPEPKKIPVKKPKVIPTTTSNTAPTPPPTTPTTPTAPPLPKE